ncbi:MAG TPA: VOC family protein [Ktedonobacteraceae bacterium]|nr:VOC family protein [Ktedonobacteraceae bacterium]
MQIDHLVLTGEAIQATCDFYSRVLGMQVVTFAEGRKALQFGKQKINLHQMGKEFDPKARHPTPGSADLCFLTPTPLEHVIAHLQFCDIPILLGPIERIGAIKPLVSLYFRDPGGTSSTSQMLADRLV